MKVSLKSKNIIGSIRNEISRLKAVKHEKRIAKYVSISPEIKNPEIIDSRELFANYAKANGVKIKIDQRTAYAYNNFDINVTKALPKKTGGVSSVSAILPQSVEEIFKNRIPVFSHFTENDKSSSIADCVLKTVKMLVKSLN